MERKTFITFLLMIGLSVLYVVCSLLVFLSRGKWGKLVRKKLTLGTMIITLSVLFSTGNLYAQQVTPAPTPTCYTPTPSIPPTMPITPPVTASPTPTPTPTMTPTIPPTPLCYTMPPPTTPPPPITNPPSVTTDPPAILMGDVDNSGTIDIVDALQVARYSVGLEVPDIDLSKADVDNSGTVDIVDALCIARKYVGLIDEYPDNSGN